MMIITIKTAGEAFCDPFTGEENWEYSAQEIERILTAEVLPALRSGSIEKKLFDINGNEVGKMKGDVPNWLLKAI